MLHHQLKSARAIDTRARKGFFTHQSSGMCEHITHHAKTSLPAYVEKHTTFSHKRAHPVNAVLKVS